MQSVHFLPVNYIDLYKVSLKIGFLLRRFTVIRYFYNIYTFSSRALGSIGIDIRIMYSISTGYRTPELKHRAEFIFLEQTI